MTPASDQETLGTVELRIPSKAEWVAVARLAVAAVASRLRFSVDEIEDVKLAIAEACTVSIEHSSDTDESIEIVCNADPDGLRIEVRDGAVPGDLDGLAEGSDRTENLGVFLIRALMDTVDVQAEPGTGLRLVMTKRVAN